MLPDWASSLRISAGEPVFRHFDTHQQWGNKASTWASSGIYLNLNRSELRRGVDCARVGDEGTLPATITHRVSKRAAGRLLAAPE
ncbi:MAG: hypothetical protein AB1704_20760 [Pseudomonadota bacterium]